MKKDVDKFRFYVIILFELLLFPYFYLFEEIKKRISSGKELKINRIREEIIEKKIFINIHEWGGYDWERSKNIKNISPFDCGLKFQIERFENNESGYEKYINLTISEAHKFKFLEEVRNRVNNIDFVSNSGMDFSGYSFFFNKIKNLPNAFVILTNTSVNKTQTTFLNDYITYMEKNPDVGILGVSYSGRMYQTFVRNNFTPHLQSFFLLTTISVLNEIVRLNNNKFPGENINHKLLLIRKGEINISNLALQLGYNLAVTLENGSVYKFGRNSMFDNGYKRWKLYKTDVRLFNSNPNLINEIN